MSSSTLKLHVIIFFLFAVTGSHAQGHHSNCKFTEGHSNGRSLSKIKGMFVFGSSLVDNGNNNFLKTLSKANYVPYGVDFELGPSGRFTNGMNVVDLFAQRLGLNPPYLPPFSDPTTKGDKVVRGVDFASGGSGILDETGSITGKVMCMKKQISVFEEITLGQLKAQLGCNSSEFLPHYLFLIGVGGNDYTINFFSRYPLNTSLSTLQDFTNSLTASLSLQLQKLYELGGRKFVLMAAYPLGCSPNEAVSTPSSGIKCVESLNTAAELFNSNLRKLVVHLPLILRGSHFVLVDSYNIITDILNDPLPKGFTNIGSPCCKVVPGELGGVLCKKKGLVCTNRSSYVYFDGLHPTEAVNIQIATKGFFSRRTSDVYPFNIHRLASL